MLGFTSRDESQDEEWSTAVPKTEEGELEKVEEDLCRSVGSWEWYEEEALQEEARESELCLGDRARSTATTGGTKASKESGAADVGGDDEAGTRAAIAGE